MAKIRQILRDNFGFFYPLSWNTLKAVEYALANSIKGHYYEFGLYQGYTFYHGVKTSSDIHHFGFDSFKGMPMNDEGGGFSFGRFQVSYKKVVKNLLERNSFTYKEHLIEGYFNETLTIELQSELKNYKPSVILIDADLYESAIQVLNFVGPLLQNGTIVIFDDWYSFSENEGEQRALKEFLLAKNIIFEELIECQNRKMFRVII